MSFNLVAATKEYRERAIKHICRAKHFKNILPDLANIIARYLTFVPFRTFGSFYVKRMEKMPNLYYDRQIVDLYHSNLLWNFINNGTIELSTKENIYASVAIRLRILKKKECELVEIEEPKIIVLKINQHNISGQKSRFKIKSTVLAKQKKFLIEITHLVPPQFTAMLKNKTVRVAIIGSAGRKGDAARMSSSVLDAMVKIVPNILVHAWNLDINDATFVSGGAAWSDHVAVRLFLESNKNKNNEAETNKKTCNLCLYIPAPLANVGQTGYPGCLETKNRFDRFDAGRIFNYYHHQFAKTIYNGNDKTNPISLHKINVEKTNLNLTLEEIQFAKTLGARIDSDKVGFKQRNTAIAKNCDYLICIYLV